MNAEYDKPIIKSMELQDNQNPNNKDIYEQIDSIVSESGYKIEIQKDDTINGSTKLRLKLWPDKAGNIGHFLKDHIVIKLKDGRTLNVPMRIFYSTQTLTSKVN